MKDKIFIDSDIILDVVFDRKPFVNDSKRILALIEQNLFEGYTSSLIIANCYYIISANVNNKIALKTINKLRSIFKILPFSDKEIGESINSQFKDFEDGIEYFIALNHGINTIITRNINDYKKAKCSVFMPTDFVNLRAIKEIINNLDLKTTQD